MKKEEEVGFYNHMTGKLTKLGKKYGFPRNLTRTLNNTQKLWQDIMLKPKVATSVNM